jgi:uracil-DNA glycosylase family 4
MNCGSLPANFPSSPVMFVGHNFDCARGYGISIARGGEVEGQFWTRLLRVLEAAGLGPESCFFTNALMGLKPGSAEGPMPSVPGYREQCKEFLRRQVEIVRPCAIVALGSDAIPYVVQLNSKYVALKHPSNWDFRALSTQDALLRTEGERLRKFLNPLGCKLSAWTKDEFCYASRQEKEQGIRTIREVSMTGRNTGNDAWGFRLGTRSSFLMAAIEKGGKSKRAIREEFEQQFPDSAGKSTFNVFFSDVSRPFGSANASRCVFIPEEEGVAIYLDSECARVIKEAIAAGMLKEINPLENRRFPKRYRREVDAIIRKYNGPVEVGNPN